MHLKKISDNISLYYDNDKKVKVCNILQVIYTEQEEENTFFTSVDIKESICYCIINEDGERVESSMWFHSECNDMSFVETYPSELKEIIFKGLKSSNNFWKDMRNIYLEPKDFSSLVDKNLSEFDRALSITKKATTEFNESVIKLKKQTGDVDVDELINRYFFRKHLLIRGKKGGGKTYIVDKKLHDEGIDYDFIAGHEGMESTDLLGYYVKNQEGNLVWLDGALSKAFRKAQTQKHAIFFDEMLRMPSRELNILVGALTPSSRGTYRLRTNRIINEVDGIGETETLEVPVENLWLIGTTNVGAGYNVDDIDEALADRVRIVNKDVDGAELEKILLSCNPAFESVIPSLVSFYTQINDMVVSGELEKEVNLRHLCEVLTLANDKSEIKTYMYDLLPTWCSTNTDGSVNKSEKEIIVKIIKKMIKD